MKHTIRILSLLLAAALLFSCVPMAENQNLLLKAYAYSSRNDDYSYEWDDSYYFDDEDYPEEKRQLPSTWYNVYYVANGYLFYSDCVQSTNGSRMVPYTLIKEIPTKTVTLTFNTNGGDAIESVSRNSTFLGWTDDPNATYASTPGVMYFTSSPGTLKYLSFSPTYYYAFWNDPTFSSLPVPKKDNDVFTGWYTKPDGGELVTENTVIHKSMTLYARWEEKPDYFTLSYDANGGDGAPEPQTMSWVGWDIIFVDYKKPTKTTTVIFDPNDGSAERAALDVSSDFRGWNTERDGSGRSYNPGDAYLKKEDLILYAQWRDFSDFDFYYFPIPERDGYEFDGWYTAREGGEPVSISTPIPVDNTLYAHWTKLSTYTVRYDANGGTGAPTSQIKTEGESLMLSTELPIKTYTVIYDATGGTINEKSKTVSCLFRNWNTQADGMGKKYNAASFYETDESVTLYAQWSDPAFGLLEAPTREGYKFMGWYTEANGGSLINVSTSLTKDTTIYANWEKNKNSFSVTYNANGGTGAPASQTKTEGKDLILSKTKPTKSFTLTYNANGGAVSPASRTLNVPFVDWNTKQDGKGTSFAPGAVYETDAKATLYAQWAAPKVGDLSVPTRAGYTFNGWFTEKTGGTEVTSGAVVSEDLTLYAHWTARLLGDVDQSADVTAADARLALRQAVGLETFTSDLQTVADLDEDGSVTAADARLILRTAVGLEPLRRVGEARPRQTYTVSYNANGGTGAPGSQTKTEGRDLTLSSAKPTKSYKLTYNANGGSVTPASKTVNAAFKDWNTASDGKGTSYAPGGTYKTDANVTLYARWTNPTAGDLPIPTRSGCIFAGWFTANDGGTKVTKNSTVSGNTTLYAHWTVKEKPEDIFKNIPTEYWFSVGTTTYSAGLDVYADGSFSGFNSSGGMGSGNFSQAKYSGTFKNVKKIDARTYSMQVASLTYDVAPGTVIDDDYGMKITYTTSPMAVGDTVMLYLPGKASKDLPNYLVNMAGTMLHYDSSGPSDFYAFYNVNKDMPFWSADNPADD